MPKADSIDTLMDCAIKAFSDWGFEGASLRQIAAQAGVPLSTINMYFGSKKELYVAAETTVWNEITDERNALLQHARDGHPGQPLTLRELIAAIALPIVSRALSNSEEVMARVHFIQGRLNEHRTVGGTMAAKDRQVEPWIDAMSQACPTLSRQDVIWAFSYCIGVVYSWQLIDHRYDGLLGQDTLRTVDSVLDDVVSFCCAGVQAMIERRAKECRTAAG
jgi:AcrR family transcriptional regulator